VVYTSSIQSSIYVPEVRIYAVYHVVAESGEGKTRSKKVDYMGVVHVPPFLCPERRNPGYPLFDTQKKRTRQYVKIMVGSKNKV
jgi:hypothetical protein